MPKHFSQYGDWVDRYDTLGDGDREAVRERIGQMPWQPLFSIIALSPQSGVVSNSHASIASVREQLYPHWELWLPSDLKVASVTTDPRLRLIQKAPTIDLASLFSAALAAADGDFVLPLPLDTMFAENALYELARVIGEHPEAELCYSDEDQIDAAGRRVAPRFKTGWDPDLVLGRDATGLLVAYRKSLLNRVGGIRPCVPGTILTLYDLSLRASSAISPGHIHHIPAVLCHRSRAEPAFGWDAEGGREIVRRHLVRNGIRGSVVPAPLAPSCNRIVREVPDPAPLVSVIVPTRDRADLLERCTDALLRRTDYPTIELLIVDNGSLETKTSDLLRALSCDSRVRVLFRPGPFNYSALNNHAAAEARGDILLLLNNDTDVTHSDWLREMVSHVVRPDVGAVGAKLLYEDGRVQHAGMVLGPGLAATHQLRWADSMDAGPGGELAFVRTVTAVTGACLAVRRSVFFEIGGLDENLRIAFNDVDMCMRIGDHGYRVLWTPFAELVHLECASRGTDDTLEKQAIFAEELRYFCRSWRSLLDADPYHNPNVIFGCDIPLVLAAPPRRKHPWLA